MTRLLLDLILLFNSGVQTVLLPGTPVAVEPFNGGFAVACTESSVICFVDTSFDVQVLDLEVVEPRDLYVWGSELVVSDYAGFSLVTDSGNIFLPGKPNGICEVFWNSPEVSELAVALFDPGKVILMDQDGSMVTLIDMPGVKSLSSCDADGDGDMDIFASGCGSGVVFIENVSSSPVVHYVGNIQAGVKMCCAVDMDGDGLEDVAGIACAEGGAGWWRNPGNTGEEWVHHEIDHSLEGPKCISCSGDSLVIASLFSKPFFTFDLPTRLPGGFTCCYISSSGYVILGHRLGFLLKISLNGGLL